MPGVRIVIPTRNRYHLLQQAVDSVLAQTFTDWELFIVDDGSEDETPRLGESLARNNESIFFKRHENSRGANTARNTGIQQCCCEYIALLDDDDTWTAQKLYTQVRALTATKADLCYCAKKYWNPLLRTWRVSDKSPRFADRYKSIMYDNFIGISSCVLLRRKMMETVGGFDSTLPALQDYDLFIRLLYNGARLVHVHEPLVHYGTDTGQKNISAAPARYRRAASMLRKKYRGYPHFALLKYALLRIRLKRTLTSPRYILDLLHPSEG